MGLEKCPFICIFSSFSRHIPGVIVHTDDIRYVSCRHDRYDLIVTQTEMYGGTEMDFARMHAIWDS